MKKYRFMWGGKLSVMLTEAMLSQLCSTIDEKGKEVSSGVSETLFVIENGVFEHHMPERSIKQLEKVGRKFLDRKYAKMINKKIDNHTKDFFKFCEKIKKTDFSKLSNSKLKEVVEQYHYYPRMGLIFFAVSSPFSTFPVEARIKQILKEKTKDENLVEDYFISLSTPEEMDETMMERIDFSKLMDKQSSDRDLVKYARKYPALFLNTYDSKEIMFFLESKLKEKKSKEERELEIKRIKDNLVEISKKHKKIYDLCKSKELEELSKQLQKVALDRYSLKHVWSGIEYMCLHLLQELSDRIGLKIEDFVKTYSFTDIYKFLDTNEKLSSSEVKDRKKCTIFHFIDGNFNYHYGEEGLKLKNKLLELKKEKEPEEELVKGSIANKGRVTGRVRLVNVRDLRHFVEDSKKFKKGEILVTTMTSPIMVPIIEKAGAIVTVEGGICSHAAVISREFGIPCIVGIGNATKVLKDGDIIEVDANNGVVKILERK